MTADDTAGAAPAAPSRAPREGAAHGPLGTRVWVYQKPEPRAGAERSAGASKPPGGKPGANDPGHTTLKLGRKNLGHDANGLVVLRRLAFDKREEQPATDRRGKLRGYLPHTPLHGWAEESDIGQRRNPHLEAVLDRRKALLERLSGSGSGASGGGTRHVSRRLLVAEWRLITGLGLQFGILDSGIALHGTYGWPIIPSATLKGIAGVGAELAGADSEQVRRVLGDPRPGHAPAKTGPKGRGGVVFLDTLPLKRGVRVHEDTITPHQQPYYTSTFPAKDGAVGAPEQNGDTADNGVGNGAGEGNGGARPPAEHHNPVPVNFLSVSGSMHVDLVGESTEDLEVAAGWLHRAGQEMGVGGRTTAGYGYFDCVEYREEEQR